MDHRTWPTPRRLAPPPLKGRHWRTGGAGSAAPLAFVDALRSSCGQLYRGSWRRDAGFTLVEVMVALFIMALLSAMAWRGIDGLVNARAGAREASRATLAMSTVMTQWEADLSHIQQSTAAPGLTFDGATVRMTRNAAAGMQLVVWSLQGNRFMRWASPPVTRIDELQEWWMRSQQWSAISGDALTMFDQVGRLRVYFYRGNAWTNAQSSGDRAFVQEDQTAEDTGNEGETEKTPDSTENPDGTGQAEQITRGFTREQLPSGVRMILALPEGEVIRDVLVAPTL